MGALQPTLLCLLSILLDLVSDLTCNMGAHDLAQCASYAVLVSSLHGRQETAAAPA